MATRRHKQYMPTPELLEEIYECLESAEQRVFAAHAQTEAEQSLARAMRHTIGAVQLLADLVDRELGQ